MSISSISSIPLNIPLILGILICPFITLISSNFNNKKYKSTKIFKVRYCKGCLYNPCKCIES